MSNEHLKGALERARKAIKGVVIPPNSLELVDFEEMGNLRGNYKLREVFIGYRTVEARTRTQVESGARIMDHERTERISDGVHSIVESWASFRKTGSRITATGEELNENTEWTGCRCRFDCKHRQGFRERMANLGINWKG